MSLSSLSLVVIIFSCFLSAAAQGICVPDSLTLGRIQGRTLAHLADGDTPLRDIEVSLSHLSKPLEKIKVVKSNDRGEFAFKSVKAGTYRLIAHYPGLKDFHVNLRVKRAVESFDTELVIWLGAKFTEPCDGSYAEIVRIK